MSWTVLATYYYWPKKVKIIIAQFSKMHKKIKVNFLCIFFLLFFWCSQPSWSSSLINSLVKFKRKIKQWNYIPCKFFCKALKRHYVVNTVYKSESSHTQNMYSLSLLATCSLRARINWRSAFKEIMILLLNHMNTAFDWLNTKYLKIRKFSWKKFYGRYFHEKKFTQR